MLNQAALRSMIVLNERLGRELHAEHMQRPVSDVGKARKQPHKSSSANRLMRPVVGA
jgi:hypothetical protein